MSLMKLALPPGVAKNGTLYQNSGRWYSADLVRWTEGAMQPIGGWERIQDSNGDIDLEGPLRGLLAWRNNAGAGYLAMGTPRQLYTFTGGAVTEITPSDFVTGSGEATSEGGSYGDGAYGAGPYGTGTETINTLTEANSWSMDNYGEDLLAVAVSDGRILLWDSSAGGDAAPLTNAPTDALGVVVTPERFVVALGPDGDPRRVEWADQVDYTIWTPATTNQAGGDNLPGHGEIMLGHRMRNETLILTTNEIFAMRYIGSNAVYRFVQVGVGGIISRRAFAAVDGRGFWMGHRGFYMYDGSVKDIPCSISDAIFPNLNVLQRSKVCAIPHPDFREIWFCYPGNDSENSKVAVYNYAEQHWSGPWDLTRTAGVPRAPFEFPVHGDASGSIYFHETGSEMLHPDEFATGDMISTGTNVSDGNHVTFGSKVYTFQATLTDSDGNVHIGADAEGSMQNLLAAVNLSDEGESSTSAGTDYAASMTENPDVRATISGDNLTITVTAKYPGPNGNGLGLAEAGPELNENPSTGGLTGGTDEALVPSAESGPFEIGNGDQVLTITRVIPDENSLGSVDLELFAGFYPTGTETSQSITTLDEPTDARITGRQARVRIQQDETGWRLGVLRLEVMQRGRR